MKIKAIKALEVLDSRGNPTVEAQVRLDSGQTARAIVPSGASTGTHEALELRDNDQSRYHGKGVLQAVQNINQKITPKLVGVDASNQEKIDQIMLELDGTDLKKNLGANAILAVSMAVSRAAAKAQQIPLYQHLAQLFDHQIDKLRLPMPMMNVLNGGKHALGSSDMQEYMIMPVGATNIAEAIRWGAEIFHTLGKILKKQGQQTTVGDEGGYAPKLSSNEEPLKLILQAIQQAGYKPGSQVAIAMDPAATEFYQDGQYHLAVEDKVLSSEEMVDRYAQWVEKYPIVSIEDGLAEDDWAGFKLMTQKLGDKIQVMGDDLFVTNPKRLSQGIEQNSANSILIKLNQIGTVTQTIKTIKMAHQANMTAVVSHRSGETEDTFIADFAVASNCGQIKTGSLSRSERIAKYNQLIRIEQQLGEKAKLAQMPYASN